MRLAIRRGIIALLVLATSVVAVWLILPIKIGNVNSKLLAKDWSNAASVIDAMTRANAHNTLELFSARDKADAFRIRERIESNKKAIDDAFETLDKSIHIPEEKALLLDLKVERAQYVASFTRVAKLLEEGQRDEALNMMTLTTLPTLSALQENVHALSPLLKKEFVDAGAADKLTDIDLNRNLILLFGLAALCMGIDFSCWVGCMTTRPLSGTAKAGQGFGLEERLAQLTQQRDSLVREVHHRVKNNLQGVAGLLRQYAHEHPESRNILDQAVSQIRTVAMVHGLQGQTTGNAVALFEMVTAIVHMVESLMAPGIKIDLLVKAPIPFLVSEQEAVPIALILNELVTNSVKHTNLHLEAGVPAVRIMASCGMDKVRISVCNPGVLPAAFDFLNGHGIGTGLDLVRSLLPPAGGHLSFANEQAQVEAMLELASPVIEMPGGLHV